MYNSTEMIHYDYLVNEFLRDKSNRMSNLNKKRNHRLIY